MIRDLIGRGIAEGINTRHVWFAHLTYGGGNHLDARYLNPDHIREWVKRVRNAGYPMRHVTAGEYGTKYGRAHWHSVIFWQDNPPEIEEFHKRFHWKYWCTPDQKPRGFAMIEPVHNMATALGYAFGYGLKNAKTEKPTLIYSKYPALGHVWFDRQAQELARQRLPLRDFRYQFSDVLTKEGKPWQYFMRTVTRSAFVESYLKHLAYYHPQAPVPKSQELMEFLERQSMRDMRATPLTMRQICDMIEHRSNRTVHGATVEAICTRWPSVMLVKTSDGEHFAVRMDQWGNELWRDYVENLGEQDEPKDVKIQRLLAGAYQTDMK